mmetsp:Transcript_35197/g.99642  ORF Transcript_35197/g.99642 Transcript_35197/m.99642 type:complete len:320 (-) Transcript_35197:1151-2110(-)
MRRLGGGGALPCNTYALISSCVSQAMMWTVPLNRCHGTHSYPMESIDTVISLTLIGNRRHPAVLSYSASCCSESTLLPSPSTCAEPPPPPPCFFFCSPLTMSSMRSSMVALSTAVLMVCALTSYGSHTPNSFMSAIFPVLPSTPKVQSPPSACLARSLVMVRITLAPQFCARVRGITSRVEATARYAHCSVPCTLSAFSRSFFDTAISTAPPPGTSLGFRHTFLATPMASARLRSTSFKMSLEGPRSMMVQAFGSSQSMTNAKYSSPIFLTSNSPALVPMSSARISSGRLTIVAPQARAMRLLSVLRRRRMALMPAFMK